MISRSMPALRADMAGPSSCRASPLMLRPKIRRRPFQLAPGDVRVQIEELNRNGTRVAVIEPELRFLELTDWGANVIDPTLAGPAYRIGREQAVDKAAAIGDFWLG
jgi:hypothetical protein